MSLVSQRRYSYRRIGAPLQEANRFRVSSRPEDFAELEVVATAR